MTHRNVDVQTLIHDLRNPLAAIYTAVSVIRELPSETPLSTVEPHIRLILSAAEQSRDLLNQADHSDGSEGSGSSE